jgi:hypothetical protein
MTWGVPHRPGVLGFFGFGRLRTEPTVDGAMDITKCGYGGWVTVHWADGLVGKVVVQFMHVRISA